MFRFTCSVMLWGGRGTADKCHWRVWGTLAVFWPHWDLPPPPTHGCVLSLSLLLRLQAAPQGAGPELCALPRPKPHRFRFLGTPQRRRQGWACVLCLPAGAAQAARSLMSTLSPGAVCLIPSAVPASDSTHEPCVSSGKLICDPPC